MKKKRGGYFLFDVIILVYLSFIFLLSILSNKANAYSILVSGLLLVAVASLKVIDKNNSSSMRFVRHWYPVALIPLHYYSLQHLNRLVTENYFDSFIITLEQNIFGFQPSQELWLYFSNTVLSEFFHFSYLFYLIVIPAVAVILYTKKEYFRFRLYVSGLLTVFFISALFFIFFPVIGPFHYFGPLDLGSISFVFYSLVHKMLETTSSLGTAFPSTHVAVSSFIWVFCHNFLKRWSKLALVIASGILVGTVYGGFHYAVDALAGSVVGLLVGLVGLRLYGKGATKELKKEKVN